MYVPEGLKEEGTLQDVWEEPGRSCSMFQRTPCTQTHFLFMIDQIGTVGKLTLF